MCCLVHILATSNNVWQVGPVISPSEDVKKYEGQYVSAGFSGHGMPRAFAWCVFSYTWNAIAIVYTSNRRSAEAVAGMIASDILDTQWTIPEWLPKHYLTVQH